MIQHRIVCLHGHVSQIVVASVSVHDGDPCIFHRQHKFAVLSGDDVCGNVPGGWIHAQEPLANVETEREVALSLSFHGLELQLLSSFALGKRIEPGQFEIAVVVRIRF